MREIEALEPMRFTLITERRRHPPRAATAAETARLGATCSTATSCRRSAAGGLRPGDRLRIETPGGGGHGSG